MIMQGREPRITHQIQPSTQPNPYLLNWVPIAEDHQLIERLNHESRTALCIVMLTTETLQSDLLGPVTKSQAQALTKIYENASHLKTILSGTLQLDPTARIYANTANVGGGVAMGSNLSLLNLGGALLAAAIFGNQPNDLAPGDGTINPLFAAAAVESADGAGQVYLPLIVQD